MQILKPLSRLKHSTRNNVFWKILLLICYCIVESVLFSYGVNGLVLPSGVSFYLATSLNSSQNLATSLNLSGFGWWQLQKRLKLKVTSIFNLEKLFRNHVSALWLQNNYDFISNILYSKQTKRKLTYEHITSHAQYTRRQQENQKQSANQNVSSFCW